MKDPMTTATILIQRISESQFPLDIQKVLELTGAIHPDYPCNTSVYAHVSYPISLSDKKSQAYACLAIFPQHGIMNLGNIDPKTKRFEGFNGKQTQIATYTRARNHVIKRVSIPAEQREKLKTLDEVLAIEGITIKRELIPSD